MRISAILFVLVFQFGHLFAQNGYNINITIDGYNQDTLFLANHYGKLQYIKDSVAINDKGQFIFKGDEALSPGMYLIVMAPDNSFFQLIIDTEQNMTIHTKEDSPAASIKIKGSPMNTEFYKYLNFLGSQRPLANEIAEKLKAAKEAGDDALYDKLADELDVINKGVQEYQNKIISRGGNSLFEKIVVANQELHIPDYKDQEDSQLKRYHYAKKHWFDNINLGDGRFLRTPVMFEKVNYYVEKLTPQHPDSIIIAVDYVLEKMKPAEESFKYYLIHFLNKYAKSDIVGMEAVYVHIGEKYYKGGAASWTDEDQLKKIIENVEVLKPLLIGKSAPDLALQIMDVDKTLEVGDSENEHARFKKKGDFNLKDVDADYTVFFVWDPECGHCKKQLPFLKTFYEKYKSQGVEIVALCNSVYKDIPKCAKILKDEGMINWINAMDPYIKSKYKQVYNVKTTPQLYILNRDGEIIMKKINTDQLDTVMEQIIKRDAEEIQKKVK